MKSNNNKINLTRTCKSCLSSLFIAVALGAGFAPIEAGATAVCITSDPFNLSGTHTKVIPFGCEATTSVPFTFLNVPDAGDVLHNLTINTMEFFASHQGVGGVFITGSIDSTAFNGIAVETHTRHIINYIATPGATNDFTIPTMEITPVDPSAAFFRMKLDPNKVSGGTFTVNIDSAGLYEVSSDFSLFFDASLNGGLSYVSIDPQFSLATFDEANANPKIQAFIAASVPEPGTIAMILGGLGLMGFMTRRRKEGHA